MNKYETEPIESDVFDHSKENDENVPTLNDTLTAEALQERSDEKREEMAEGRVRDREKNE